MKTIFLLCILCLCFATDLYAQEEQTDVFRKAYLQFGLNQLGHTLKNGLSPKENVLMGNLGTQMGFAFEFGKHFYFGSSGPGLKYGLDWTILSLTFNKLDWDGYAKANQATNYTLEDPAMVLSLGSKIGPVLSFNPIERLVIDLRTQLVPIAYYFGLAYEEWNGTQPTRYFSISNNTAEREAYGEEISNPISFGIQPDFGLTLRRRIIGFSIDYLPGGVKEYYRSNDGNDKDKIQTGTVQFKLSFIL